MIQTIASGSRSGLAPLTRALSALLLIVSLSGMTGCGFTYHFKNGSTLPGEQHNEWASYFVFGLVGDNEINVKDFCPGEVHEITTGNNFVTWLLSAITLGIYTPRKVNITCSGGEYRTSFEVDFGKRGEPSRVTKRVGSVAYSGEVQPLGDGRYGVALQEGSAP